MTNDFFGDRNYALDGDSWRDRSVIEDTRLVGGAGGSDRFCGIEEGEEWKNNVGGEEWIRQLKRSNLTIEADSEGGIGGRKKRSGWFLCCW